MALAHWLLALASFYHADPKWKKNALVNTTVEDYENHNIVYKISSPSRFNRILFSRLITGTCHLSELLLCYLIFPSMRNTNFGNQCWFDWAIALPYFWNDWKSPIKRKSTWNCPALVITEGLQLEHYKIRFLNVYRI